ncbi:MAG: type II toxin-antitoxin system VapC family toxin [Myxococcales bacterium]|nr:type II toxin-antitoxin system VapC family toxin [Myxococcales bacterium]
MRLLLDTHVLLWALSSPERLTVTVRDKLRDSANDVGVSSVSAAELAVKQSIGKLRLPGPVTTWLPPVLRAMSFKEVPLHLADASRLEDLPWLHRDPFDRLLIAQALGGWTLVSSDELVRRYDVPTLWD